MSKNARNAAATKNKNKVKMGIQVPRNTKEALFFNWVNKNALWADSIFKEMCGLWPLNVFKFHLSNHKCDRKYGWQFAPMHMIFDIKQQDMQYKACLVVGGHVIDSLDYTTYSSVIENISVRLLFLAAQHQVLGIMMGDIGNAFPTALGNTMQQMGFTPMQADQDLWHCKANNHASYDFIATHVNDIAIAALRPAEYINMIEQEFLVCNKEDSPPYYLGNDLKLHQDGHLLHVSNKTYFTKALRKYQLEH
jgi:hypothetical protein